MPVRLLTLVLTLLLAGTLAAQDVNTDKGKLSYALGWDLGKQIQSRSTEINVDSVVAAIRDAASGKDSRVTQEDMVAQLREFSARVQKEREAAIKKLAAENQIKSDKYLAENRKKKGITVLPSGIQYRVIEEGEGPRPKADGEISIHYRGSKMDGREFDSSFARGVPLTGVKVDSVMKGWQEVLPLMKVGATWQVFMPPEMAFGEAGQPPVIGPNEALSFDLKLVEITK
ncbi:MAG: FKBP-type peptidyl-prolyl cis-trans isomerase [Xanthomonadales bacterium]|nr:FKBP-type peptidyl-prolyl cis-trans isomerase [Xanthomonadales bacterium]